MVIKVHNNKTIRSRIIPHSQRQAYNVDTTESNNLDNDSIRMVQVNSNDEVILQRNQN
jgi:hypothetical protein